MKPFGDIQLRAFMKRFGDIRLRAFMRPFRDIQLRTFMKPFRDIQLRAFMKRFGDIRLRAFMKPFRNIQLRTFMTPFGDILLRHMGRRILAGIGGVLVAVLTLLTLVDFIEEVRHVRSGGYTFAHALHVMLLTTPQRIYEVLPVCVFVGALLSLGQLTADNEMTALRAASVGVRRVAQLLLVMGSLMALLTIFIGEIIAPPSMERAWEVKQQHRPPISSNSLWLRERGDFIHLHRGASRGHLSGVLVYQLDSDGALERSLHAHSARFDNGHWIFEDVRESLLHADGRVTEHHYAHYYQVVLPPPDMLELMLLPVDEMPIKVLNRYLTYFEDEQLNLRQYRFARWQRITTPLSCIVVLLLTVSFAFTQSRGGGLGQRIFVGVLSGIGVYLFNRVFAYLGMMMDLPAGLAAFLPLLLLLGLGAALLAARQFKFNVLGHV